MFTGAQDFDHVLGGSLGVGWVSLQEEGDHSSTRCSSGLYSVSVLILVFHSPLIMGLQNAQGRDVFRRVLS